MNKKTPLSAWGYDVTLMAGGNAPSQYQDYMDYQSLHNRNAIISWKKIHFKGCVFSVWRQRKNVRFAQSENVRII